MDAVAYHLAKDLLLLRTVKKSGYKNLYHMLDPCYILISNRLNKSTILDIDWYETLDTFFSHIVQPYPESIYNTSLFPHFVRLQPYYKIE